MDALLASVRQIGSELSSYLLDYPLEPHFQSISTIEAKKGHLLDLSSQGHVVVNVAHPLCKRLADGKPGRAELLTLAIISLVNRAQEGLTDEHQLVLHQHLMNRLSN
jgi:hypothetical protein